jgi:uncharacterized oligopeptide transporter (OPT) family protein
MSDPSRAAAASAALRQAPAAEVQHPSTFAPATLILLIVLCVFGAVIGVQLILQLGVTPNTSIIGALVAMLLARVPLAIFARYRSIHVQNLAQSAISAATFGAANSLLLPIGVPFLLGRPDLIVPMLVGAALSMLLDGYMLYRMFDTRVFPASGTWPPGIAAAEAIRAGDAGGRRAALLGVGLLVGIAGSWLKIPMSAFGVAFIGNVWALTMFGIGLLIRGYAMPVAGIDIAKLYVPHGAMVGAGLVALVQVALLIARRGTAEAVSGATDDRRMRQALGLGSVGYVGDRDPARAVGRFDRRTLARHAGRLYRLRRLRRLCARADRRHFGDACRLVPGLRGGADHLDHRHAAGLSAGGIGLARRV